MQLPPRIPVLSSRSDTRTAILQGLLIATLVIAALYVGREVLVPLALAILLSFVLTRPLVMLRRVGMPRILSVVIVVSCAFAIIFGLGWLVSREFTQLAADVPTYRSVLSEKIKGLREPCILRPGWGPALVHLPRGFDMLSNNLPGSIEPRWPAQISPIH